MPFSNYTDEELAAIASQGDMSQYSDAELEAIANGGQPQYRVSGNPDASPQEAERMRRDFVRNEGTVGTRLNERLKSMSDFSEVPRFIGDTGLAFANTLGKGLKSAASTVQGGAEAIRKGNIDAGLQEYGRKQAEYKPIEAPWKPSGTGEMLSDFIRSGVDYAGKVTGRPDVVEPVTQGVLEIAALMGLKGATKGMKIPGIEKPLASPKAIAPEVAKPKILSNYEAAVRPGVKGTGKSQTQLNKSNQNYVDGVYDIVEAKNKGIINLGKEELGEGVQNRLPKTLQEHLDATAQARRAAFDEYNQMKTDAEGNGAVIDLKPIASTLREAAANSSLNVARPNVAAYMREMANRFDKQGTFTPSQAQDAIAKFNSVVDYTKVAPEIAENAMVDKSAAAQLREAMNNVILGEGNPNYQAVKLKYGRLAKMEEEAAHRARVYGRRSPSSLFDGVIGALTASEIVAGLLRMSPTELARGAGMATFKYWRNKMNSPDHQIKKMYKIADKSYQPKPTSEPIQTYPRPEPTRFDPSIGRNIKLNQGMNERIPTNLPVGTQGYNVPRRPIGLKAPEPPNQSIQRTPLNLPVGSKGYTVERTPLNLPQGEQTYFDNTTGTTRPVKNFTPEEIRAELNRRGVKY